MQARSDQERTVAGLPDVRGCQKVSEQQSDDDDDDDVQQEKKKPRHAIMKLPASFWPHSRAASCKLPSRRTTKAGKGLPACSSMLLKNRAAGVFVTRGKQRRKDKKTTTTERASCVYGRREGSFRFVRPRETTLIAA